MARGLTAGAVAPGVELADTSVWARIRHPALASLAAAVEDGLVAVCDQVAMEVLFSARDGADFAATEAALLACPWFPVEAADWVEARRVFGALASRGPLHHRQVKIPDLLIAAVAARHDIVLVHYDADYEVIAGITGQRTRWAAPRGSL
jgi:predicted nucleic acid-binding protein